MGTEFNAFLCDSKLRREFNLACKEFGYSNFSEAMRDSMRKMVEKYKKMIEERRRELDANG